MVDTPHVKFAVPMGDLLGPAAQAHVKAVERVCSFCEYFTQFKGNTSYSYFGDIRYCFWPPDGQV